MNTEQWEVEASRAIRKEKAFPGVERQLIGLLRLQEIPHNELETKVKEMRELYPCFFFANVREGIN